MTMTNDDTQLAAIQAEASLRQQLTATGRMTQGGAGAAGAGTSPCGGEGAVGGRAMPDDTPTWRQGYRDVGGKIVTVEEATVSRAQWQALLGRLAAAEQERDEALDDAREADAANEVLSGMKPRVRALEEALLALVTLSEGLTLDDWYCQTEREEVQLWRDALERARAALAERPGRVSE